MKDFDAHLPHPIPSPIVVSVPHAGTARGALGAVLRDDFDLRCDADLYVDRLYDGLAPGAFVVAHLSRFVCDLNRDAGDLSATAVPSHPTARASNPRGFVWEMTTGGQPTLSRPLEQDEWKARKAVHDQYHGTVAAALADAKARFGHAVLIDGHSMPSRGRGGPSGHADAGQLRADIVPGDRDGISCAQDLRALVCDTFTDCGFSVAPNQPYRGGFTTAHHGRPGHGIHAIQIEMRRDLYMDETSYVIDQAGFDRIRAALQQLFANLSGYRPGAGTNRAV